MARARKTQTNNAAQPAGGSSLSRRVFAAAVVAALVLVSAVLALQILATEREAARNLEQARLTASAAASRLNAEAEGLRRLLQSHRDPAGVPVSIRYANARAACVMELSGAWRLLMDDALLLELQQLLGAECAKVRYR